MEKRAVVLLFALLVLCSAVAYADVINPVTFTVTPEAVKDQVLDPAKESAEFYITVENKGETEDTFRLLLFEDPKWAYQALPSPTDRELTIPAGGEDKFHIMVKGTNIADGIYGVRAWVQSKNTGNRNYAVLRIQMGKTAPKEPPAPNFDVDVSVPSQMDPQGTYNVIVNIKNNNERLLQDVKINLASNLLSDTTNVTVEPNETKSVSFAIILVDNVRPQQDQLNIAVEYEGKSFYDQSYNFEVVEYLPPFKTDVKVDKRFLRQDRVITITNDGNAQKSDIVRIETSLKERFFTSSKPKFKTMTEDGKYYFTWPVSLGPEDSTEIKLTTSYRLLLLVALLLIILIGYKIATSNPLIVKKKVRFVHKAHAGAISDMSVVIYMKNRGKETVKNLRVVERVSRMVQLKQDSFEGSMHPVKMHSRAGEGTLLEYRFAEIAPGDERIIKYRVYSKLHIFGMLTLKPTVVEFTTLKGVKKKSKSNNTLVPGEEQPEKKHKMEFGRRKK
jgi:hypothetical protein